MARLLTTKYNLVEKQPIHDHPPNTGRIGGKKFLTIKECLRHFPWSQDHDDVEHDKNTTIEYLDDSQEHNSVLQKYKYLK